MATIIRRRRLLLMLLLIVGLSACGAEEEARAPEGDHAHAVGGDAVGRVSFPTSCSADVQPAFEQAVAMLHSFWFDEAIETFREVSRQDPDCAMALWGEAMTLWGNPMTRAAPAEDRLAEAVDALARANELLEGVSSRERMYIRAAAALYDGHPDIGHIQRMRAHEEAMRALMEAHPEDPEAAIFYGRIVVGNAPPDDLTYARQLHAATILEPLFQARPEHPGLAHYLIHAFDSPATAEEGLDAALRYADIAPAAPHALHMPTHIFTRMGYWEESIALNTRSAAAEPVPDAAVHPLDYMVYAYLQLGRDREAGEIISRAREIPDRYYGGLIGYNFAAMQARYALERGRWEEAATTPLPVGAAPFVEAVSRFARALGAARSGRANEAGPEVDALSELELQTRRSGDAYWATVIEAQRLAASAWVALAAGDESTAIDLARRAADLEGTVEKHPVTPGPLLPARELLGDLLLEVGRPAEALAAYEGTLEVERNRARALYGAARAAEAAGDTRAVSEHYTGLLELLAGADRERPDLQAALAWESRGTSGAD
jgi:tetratricopeptide (TPR) repeat protein